jgi:hypothetical protein
MRTWRPAACLVIVGAFTVCGGAIEPRDGAADGEVDGSSDATASPEILSMDSGVRIEDATEDMDEGMDRGVADVAIDRARAGSDACVTLTCAELGYNCGKVANGCGGTLDCGVCPPGEFCGAGGFSKCGGSVPPDAPIETPATCASLGYNCGVSSDGLGGILNCGTCGPPQVCGGGGANNRCGTPDASPGD